MTYANILKTVTSHAGYAPTAQQKAFYKSVHTGKSNLQVVARAGTGKTTTIMQALAFTKTSKKARLLAFNKSIATELGQRIEAQGINNATASTFHSLGFAACRKAQGYVKMDGSKLEWLFRDAVDYSNADANGKKKLNPLRAPVKNLVSLLKSLGYGTEEHMGIHPAPTDEDIIAIAQEYAHDIDFAKETILKLVREVHEVSANQKKRIDFDDMLYHPLIHDYKLEQTDYLFVDESQDLDPVQIALVQKAIKKEGRVFFVGDDRQAIYAFRGADAEALQTISDKYAVKQFPLTKTFRCGKAIVERAKVIVPDFEAADTNPQGEVRDASNDELMKQAQSGDFVLCRTNAPLVSRCLKFLRGGKKAIVRGRDIGEQLIKSCESAEKAHPNESVAEAIDSWGAAENEKVMAARESIRIAVSDRTDTLAVLGEGCATWKELIEKIQSIFTDALEGIILSTIHKSKGLESKNVWLIEPQLIPHPMASGVKALQQEENLAYVAITRTIEVYTVVRSEEKNS